jgi:hypothetical protein
MRAGAGMLQPDITRAAWRTSSRSGGNGNCIQVASNLPGVILVRDSKDPAGPTLAFTAGEWATFTHTIKSSQENRI